MVFVIVPVFAITCLLVSFYLSGQIWTIVDTPCVTPSGAIVGLCEITGKASTQLDKSSQLKPLSISPIANIECVWFHVLVEEYKRNGKSGDWIEVYSKESSNGFRVVDGYGGVFVDLSNAKKYLTKTVDKNKSRDYVNMALTYFKGRDESPAEKLAKQWISSPDKYYLYHKNIGKYIPASYVSENRQQYYDDASKSWQNIYTQSTGDSIALGITNLFNSIKNLDLRVTEILVIPMQDIFVHGYVSFPEDGSSTNELVIGSKKKNSSSYYVSSQGENKPLTSLKRLRAVFATLGVVLSIIFLTMLQVKFHGTTPLVEPIGIEKYEYLIRPIILLLIFFVLGYIFSKLGRTFNRFIRLKQQVDMSKSTIDVVLKRRSALIPQLKTVVEEAASHEASMQQMATELRSQNDDQFAKTIFAIGEAYPNLKASQNFMALQFELGRTEEKIAMARSYLTDSVLNYNNLRATFTGILFKPFFSEMKL